jgi:hypothetical protein
MMPEPAQYDDDDDDDFSSPIGAIEAQETSVRTCVRVRKQSLMLRATLDCSVWPIKERKLWCPTILRSTNRSGYSTVR